MVRRRSRRLAGALLAVLAATLLAPLGALARVPPAADASHRCHCPVKMACCEAGLCHGGEDDAPSATPSWSGCRDEAPQRDVVPPPSAAFDTALPGAGPPFPAPASSRPPLLACAGRAPLSHAPPSPPPRSSPSSR
jgi:hypothetical protein